MKTAEAVEICKRLAEGLTIRQQAVLMMAAAMIKAGAPIFNSEEEIRAYGDAACDWADIVLRAERESRE